VPSFKAAYLIHGDDHGRIGERRARLRALAEVDSSAAGIEVFEGDGADPDAVATALSTMTFAIGRRFIVVDGVERWKDKDLDALISAIGEIADETTIAFFAREDSRLKAPARLHQAVRDSGGDISAVQGVKPWELPKWAIERARELGLALQPDASRVLVTQVGDRQQRLLRELEKLSVMYGEGARIDVAQIEEAIAGSAERKAWSLADALVSGNKVAATKLYLALRAQGERVPGLLYWISTRLRLAHDVAGALEQGEPLSQVRRRLRMPQRAASQLIDAARERGKDRLRLAIEELADLELASRGGGAGGAAEDTAALLAIQRIAD
jgi:DNA polymerase III subunit delta